MQCFDPTIDASILRFHAQTLQVDFLHRPTPYIVRLNHLLYLQQNYTILVTMRFTSLADLAYMATIISALNILPHGTKSIATDATVQPSHVSANGKAEDTRPSPPLQPTSVVETTITGGVVAPSAPLRPTSNTVITTTTFVPPKRTEETGETGYYLECTGNDAAWAYGNVCPNPDFILPVSKQECDQWCSCDDQGTMKCPSPVSGCKDDGQVTYLCEYGTPEFTCKCRKLNSKHTGRAVAVPAEEGNALVEGPMGTRRQTVGFPPLTKRNPQEPSTTIYGVALKTDSTGSRFEIPAVVVASTDTQRIYSGFSASRITPITPSTVAVQTEPIEKAKTDTAAQATTVYGLVYDTFTSELLLPAAVVPNSRLSVVLSAYSTLNITQVVPSTVGEPTPTPEPGNVIVTETVVVYLSTVTVIATAEAQGPKRDANTPPTNLASPTFTTPPQVLPTTDTHHSRSRPCTDSLLPCFNLPTTLYTKTTSKASSPLEARTDFVFECDADSNLSKNILARTCDSIAIYLSGYYCQNHCSCNSDNGCVTCDAQHMPEFVDECGGSDTVTEFCRSKHDSLDCYCKNNFNARTGC